MTEGSVSSRPGTVTSKTISKEVEKTRIRDDLKWNPRSRVTADGGETCGGKDNTSENMQCVRQGRSASRDSAEGAVSYAISTQCGDDEELATLVSDHPQGGGVWRRHKLSTDLIPVTAQQLSTREALLQLLSSQRRQFSK